MQTGSVSLAILSILAAAAGCHPEPLRGGKGKNDGTRNFRYFSIPPPIL